MSISGEISDDVTFVHKTFPVPPSTRAIIEVKVSYPIKSVGRKGTDPIMGIYTTQDHVNIKEQCTQIWYGQVRNKDLHFHIRREQDLRKMPRCLKEEISTLNCNGNITILDYIPRPYSFSFGLPCHIVNPGISLKGLAYNISIHELTNKTSCIKLPYKAMKHCYQYYHHAALPNLFGTETMN